MKDQYPEVSDIEHVMEMLNSYRMQEKERQRKIQRRLKRKQYERERYIKRLLNDKTDDSNKTL